jgi:hypothetical protein
MPESSKKALIEVPEHSICALLRVTCNFEALTRDQGLYVGNGSKREELNVSKFSPLYPTVRTSTRRAAHNLTDFEVNLIKYSVAFCLASGRIATNVSLLELRMSPNEAVAVAGATQAPIRRA